jgi:hypothetical protein
MILVTALLPPVVRWYLSQLTGHLHAAKCMCYALLAAIMILPEKIPEETNPLPPYKPFNHLLNHVVVVSITHPIRKNVVTGHQLMPHLPHHPLPKISKIIRNALRRSRLRCAATLSWEALRIVLGGITVSPALILIILSTTYRVTHINLP